NLLHTTLFHTNRDIVLVRILNVIMIKNAKGTLPGLEIILGEPNPKPERVCRQLLKLPLSGGRHPDTFCPLESRHLSRKGAIAEVFNAGVAAGFAAILLHLPVADEELTR